MKKFWKNRKGAVTVIVTLLLIPSILLAGTAVDVSRIYSAKSVVADANSLGANSALASYDALLQDLYGLYAIEDPDLAQMVNDYIETAIFGDGDTDTGLGTFQLFYGSKSSLDVSAEVTQNLGNIDVMRRQIEEYMALRAPVIIAEEVLDVLDQLEQTTADAEAIEAKLDVEDELEDIKETYKDIYNKIIDMNAYPSAESAALNSINHALDLIHGQFEELYNTRDQWNEVYNGNDMFRDEELQDLENKYDGIINNIAAIAQGGTYYQYYKVSGYDDSGAYVGGTWTNPITVYNDSNSGHEQCLQSAFERAGNVVDMYEDAVGELKDALDKAESQKASLQAKLNTLKEKLNNCSEELKNGMETPQECYGNKSLIETYEDLLDYNLSSMGTAVYNQNHTALENMKRYLEVAGYGKIANADGGVTNTAPISVSNLTQLTQYDSFEISYMVMNTNAIDYIRNYKDLSTSDYHYQSQGGFTEFQNISTEAGKFYDMLVQLMNTSSSDTEKNVKESINKMLEYIQEVYKGLVNDPEGAYYYSSETARSSEGGFAAEGDWGEDGVARDSAKDSLNGSFIKSFSDGMDDAVDKVLLVTYGTEMFSNYATNKPASENKAEESLSGVPFGVEVNYFYQSEQEYLYNGDQGNAKNNLSAVSGTILLVRFICNYISSYTIPDVNTVVDGVFAATPFPANLVVAELVRFGFVMGQSVIDLSNLRNGHKVALIHNETTWTLSLSGIANAGYDAAAQVESCLNDTQVQSSESGIDYSTYMTLFLFLVNGDKLAERIQFLVELNMTNYKNDVGSAGSRDARESKMASLELYDLDDAVTGFELTTNVDMTMLFFTMPVAQKGINGVSPPKKLTVSNTIYRGY